MPSYTIPSDSHVVGDTGHTTDHDNLVDTTGAVIALLQQLYQLVPTLPVGNANNQGNLNALAALVGSTTTALLSTQLAQPNGVASLDSNGLVPTSELPISATSLFLAGAGTASSSLGLNGDTYFNQSTGQVYAKSSGSWTQSSLLYWGQLATTGSSGVALTSSPGTLLSWTAPSDGVMHRVIPIVEIVIGSTQTGGAITFTVVDPTNTSHGHSFGTSFGGGQGAGTAYGTAQPFLVYPGSTVSVTYAAMSGGTATFYGELWGS